MESLQKGRMAFQVYCMSSKRRWKSVGHQLGAQHKIPETDNAGMVQWFVHTHGSPQRLRKLPVFYEEAIERASLRFNHINLLQPAG